MQETFEFDLVIFLGFILLALFFVLLNGFFVAAEFSLVSVRLSKMENLAQKGSGGAKSVLKALDDRDTVISATQLGITLASLALGFIAGSYFEPVFEKFFEANIPILSGNYEILGFIFALSFGALLALALTTYAHVVIGELVFKSIALQYPENTSVWIAKPLSIFTKIASPLIKLFNGTAWLILRFFGIRPSRDSRNIHSEDELKLIISQSKDAGVLEEHETQILSRTFDLADTLVKEIMTPRTELVLINVNDSFDSILDSILESGHSRLPVFEETIDKIIGFIYAKDVLQYFKTVLSQNNDAEFHPDIRSVLRMPDFVPETMHALKLLKLMQNSKKQVAVVITEFGGVAGLVSLEDVLELIVGDIQDEYDVEPPDITQTDNNNEYIISGTMSLDDFNDFFNTNFDSDLSVTFSGFVIEYFGTIPRKDDEIYIDNFNIKIKDVSNNRINELLVLRSIKEETEEKVNGKNSAKNKSKGNKKNEKEK